MQKYIALALGLIFLVVGISGCANSKKVSTPATEEKYTPVAIAKVERKTLANTTTISGKVYPDKEVMIVPKMPGKVTSVNVKVGDKINQGDVLFTLDAADVQKQADQAALQVKTAEANYQRTKEQIDLAKVNLERQKQLYEVGGISKAQLEQAELQASEKPLELAQIQVEQAKLAYRQALDSLQNMTITSPISGIVAGVNIEYGAMASNAQPAVTVVNLDPTYVLINVPENIVNTLVKGKEVEVTIPSVSDKALPGKVDYVSPSSDQRTQLYPVKISLANPDGVIKPGMFANVKLQTQVRENVVAVPSEAVILKNGKLVAYIINGDKAEEKEVSTGLDTGGYIEITQGLNPDEQIIVKGQNYVDQGSKVKVVGGK